MVDLKVYDKCEGFNHKSKYAIRVSSTGSPHLREYSLYGATAAERDEWVFYITEAQLVSQRRREVSQRCLERRNEG